MTNTSSELPSLLMQCNVDLSVFHCHFQTRWVYPMNRPTPVLERWLGHMECIAFCHSSISDAIGCSWGHRMLNHTSPRGQQDSTSGLILFPEAVRMSDIKNSCIDSCTLFSHHSSSVPYPAQRKAFIMNWSPSLGNFHDLSGMLTVILNIDSFSHSIFIHVCITRELYFL